MRMESKFVFSLFFFYHAGSIFNYRFYSKKKVDQYYRKKEVMLKTKKKKTCEHNKNDEEEITRCESFCYYICQEFKVSHERGENDAMRVCDTTLVCSIMYVSIVCVLVYGKRVTVSIEHRCIDTNPHEGTDEEVYPQTLLLLLFFLALFCFTVFHMNTAIYPYISRMFNLCWWFYLAVILNGTI